MDYTEGDGVRKKSMSLLQRYDLVVENLSFEYIAQSKNQKELERILKVLRSGEEGCYPELTRSCKDRLRDLFPDSRVLMTPQIVLDDLEKEDIKVYSSVIREKDNLLGLSQGAKLDAGTSISVPIRKITILKPPHTVATNKLKGDGDKVVAQCSVTTKCVVPRSYTEWDKFDPEEEMLKMDLEDERKMEKKEKKNKMLMNTRRKIGKYKNNKEATLTVPKGVITASEQEALAQVEKLKGNECYKARDYVDAIKHYSKGIILQPTVEHFSNRAAAYLQLKKFDACVTNCSEALNFDPWNVKALFRRGSAYMELGRLDAAVQDLLQILQIEPNNFAVAKLLSKVELEKLKNKKEEMENEVCHSTSSCLSNRPSTSRQVMIQEVN